MNDEEHQATSDPEGEQGLVHTPDEALPASGDRGPGRAGPPEPKEAATIVSMVIASVVGAYGATRSIAVTVVAGVFAVVTLALVLLCRRR